MNKCRSYPALVVMVIASVIGLIPAVIEIVRDCLKFRGYQLLGNSGDVAEIKNAIKMVIYGIDLPSWLEMILMVFTRLAPLLIALALIGMLIRGFVLHFNRKNNANADIVSRRRAWGNARFSLIFLLAGICLVAVARSQNRQHAIEFITKSSAIMEQEALKETNEDETVATGKTSLDDETYNQWIMEHLRWHLAISIMFAGGYFVIGTQAFRIRCLLVRQIGTEIETV